MEVSEVAAVERVLAGDTDAFRHLVERHSRHIFRLAFRMTGNEHDADDVVQETFLRAYRQIANFELRAGFGTWLHRIAVNCALDLMKSRERKELSRAVELDEVLEIGTDPHQDSRVRSAEVREAVGRALDRLTANERIAFVLRHYEGRTLEEIGDTLGTRLNATKNTVFRAVRKLREELAPLMRSQS